MQSAPFSPACERNKAPIKRVLALYLKQGQLLEVGSGTGQHAVYFAQAFPEICWQPADLKSNIAHLRVQVESLSVDNLRMPIELDVQNPPTDLPIYNYVFSANTLHIMSWQAVTDFFALLKKCIKPQGYLLVYGPFNYEGDYSSESNGEFDRFLKAGDPYRGIRSFEDVQSLASAQGFSFVEDHPMPAHNQLLVWQMCRFRH